MQTMVKNCIDRQSILYDPHLFRYQFKKSTTTTPHTTCLFSIYIVVTEINTE
jgi:5'(3')-deoxyribonucleotidase